MVEQRGWVNARGRFYSRYIDRRNQKGLEWVDKHSGEVFRDVVMKNGCWTGVDLLDVEPKYLNFSGADRRVHTTPLLKPITLRKLSVGRNEIKLKKLKKPRKLFAR